MVNDFAGVARYVLKPIDKVKRICEPLHDLGIPVFGFVSVDQEGNFCNIGNAAEALDHFFRHKLYNDYPYMRNPALFKSGWTSLPLTTIISDKKHSSYIRNTFGIDHQIMKLEKVGDRINMFFFTGKDFSEKDCLAQLNVIRELEIFSSYFKREAESLIGKIFAEGYNIKKALGPIFDQPHPGADLLVTDVQVDRFLKKIAPLAPQERLCLDLFKQGYSAQGTAARLGISRRTVEHYFESIMRKLNVNSKWELLNW